MLPATMMAIHMAIQANQRMTFEMSRRRIREQSEKARKKAEEKKKKGEQL